MKHIILLLIAFALLFGCTSGSSQAWQTQDNATANSSINASTATGSEQSGDTAYSSGREELVPEKIVTETDTEFIYTNNGFLIAYPKDWDVVEEKGATKLRLMPPGDENNEFNGDIAIGSSFANGAENAGEYAKNDAVGIKNRLNISVESNKTEEIGGITYYTVVFESRNVNNITIRQMRRYIVNEGIAYFLTISAETTRFAEFLNISKPIVDSFKIR